MNKIIGRNREVNILNQAITSSESEFIAVYGRRRVGKTYLIKTLFTHYIESNQSKDLFFQTTGIHKATLSEQLAEFKRELESLYYELGIPVSLQQPKTWLEAFQALTNAMRQVKGKLLIFFDELPWMATQKSKCLQALDYYWNRHWSEMGNIKLTVCGSAASWIIDNILNNKGGLHNRVTRRLLIEPFNLYETYQYLLHRNISLNQKQVCQVYLCLGGIPYYLKFIQRGLSATQNINEICFSKQGGLRNEFQNLFSSLFKQSHYHEKIVSYLAEHPQGVIRSQIVKYIDLNGGALTRILNELEHAGFIASFLPWKSKTGMRYKLIDEYSLFYLTWVKPALQSAVSGVLADTFWNFESQSPRWRAWSGYAFEALCFKHIPQIQTALKIPNGAIAATWQYFPKKNDKLPGVQIDLLFDRPDGIINICEIKYTEQPFLITGDYAKKLKLKCEVYQKITHSDKQMCVSMISHSGLKRSPYLDGLVWSQSSLSDLFQA